MSAAAGPNRASRSQSSSILALAGAAFVIAAIQGAAAAGSPDNCGELPGIARFGAMVIASGIGVGILVIGGVAAAVMKRAVVFGAAAAIGLAVIAGVVVGVGLGQPYPCG